MLSYLAGPHVRRLHSVDHSCKKKKNPAKHIVSQCVCIRDIKAKTDYLLMYCGLSFMMLWFARILYVVSWRVEIYTSFWILFGHTLFKYAQRVFRSFFKKLQFHILQGIWHWSPRWHSIYFERKIINGKSRFFQLVWNLDSIKI